MIYFFADDHFGTHAGKVIFDRLEEAVRKRCVFAENDFSLLESGSWVADCELLVLHLIGTTCALPHPGAGAEKAVKSYVASGRPLLLLHGSSAAFWQWEWWRRLPGRRWVRPADPDGVTPSVHPQTPCEVKVSKVRHELASKLENFSLADDEVYINLEETSPTMTLMETTIAEGTFAQCCETVSPYGNRIVSFIPGHKMENTANPALLRNVGVIINYLLEENHA